MHTQIVVTETQGNPMDHGLANHVRQLQTNVEQVAQGADLRWEELTFASVMIGDEIRYSTIAAIAFDEKPAGAD